MGIAYSGSKIVYGTFPAETRSQLIAGLHAYLVEAEWPWELLADGYKYTITSPQGFKAKMTLRDTGKLLGPGAANPAVDIYFMSEDEVRVSPIHWLRVWEGHTLQVIANICQIWVSAPGDTTGLATMVCGGIPSVATTLSGECEVSRGDERITTEVWWSDNNVHPLYGYSVGGRGFRRSFFTQLAQRYAACRNGDLLTSYLDNTGYLRLLPLAQHPAWALYIHPPPVTLLFNDEPLLLDPLLMWGATWRQGPDGKSAARIYGQVWDAVFRTKDSPIDDVLVIDDVEAMNFMHEMPTSRISDGTRLGCLYLFRESAGVVPGLGGPFHYAY